MQSTGGATLRCVAITDGAHPRRWEMRILATLARSGLATPLAIWRAEPKPDRTLLERLGRRRADRRALSFAPMTTSVETLGLPVVPLPMVPAEAPADIDVVLDFRAEGSPDDLASVPQPRQGRWLLRIGGGTAPSAAAGVLATYCTAAPAVEAALIQQDAGGTARLLFSGRFPKRASFVETVDSLLLNLTDAYQIACRKLHAGQPLPATEPTGPSPPVSLGAAVAPWLKARCRSLLSRRTIEIWNIGMAPRPAFEELAKGGTIAGVSWLPPSPELTFRADPFGWIDAEGRTAIAHERFDYRAGKGTLEIARLTPVSREPSFESLADLPVHASYPYVMPVGDLLLCLPEVNESGRTLLFKIESAPTRLTYVTTLLEDVPLSDGTIFRFGEHHWLFGTRADRDSQLRLYAWFSRAVDGPWRPHALNPIKCDITSARPAGTPFWAGGSLIRPAQDCSHSYGGAIALNRILELTPTSFREETISRLMPDPSGPCPDGIHTLSFVGDSLLIDGKRHVFRWDAAALNRNFTRRRQERQAMFRGGASKR